MCQQSIVGGASNNRSNEQVYPHEAIWNITDVRMDEEHTINRYVFPFSVL